VIGPGWLPSRPRPLGRVRKSLLAYTGRRRPRRGAPRSTTSSRAVADGAAPGCNTIDMLFDGVPAELPIATLLPGRSHARHRVLGGHLRHWLAERWTWLRPRTVPMIVAFAGMLAVLGTTKYLTSYAAPRHGAMVHDIRDGGPQPRMIKARAGSSGHGRIHIVPVRPGSGDVTITLEP